MFPQRLDSPQAYDIAKAMMDGFNRHYRLFRAESARAKHRFETADWHGQQRAQRERIEFYDLRVKECTMRLEKEFKAGAQPMEVWQQVKLHYIGLLVDHHQPELAETFFNSVTTKILHRTHFHNDFIFVRPAVSTEYIENDEPAALPTYRAYYPTKDTLRETLIRIVDNFQLQREFEDLDRDVENVVNFLKAQGEPAYIEDISSGGFEGGDVYREGAIGVDQPQVCAVFRRRGQTRDHPALREQEDDGEQSQHSAHEDVLRMVLDAKGNADDDGGDGEESLCVCKKKWGLRCECECGCVE